ncbi:MAG: hypothetical protein IPI49_27015 [Myxococcales bacterium]|nr:hypothetical protein [Myxococcales bacterium]
MMKNTLISALAALLFSACTTLGSEQSSVSNSASDCDRTGSGQTCQIDADCGAGEECEDGACKLHGGACEGDSDDSDTDSDSDGGGGAGSGATCTTDSQCPAGQECEDGACKPHTAAAALTTVAAAPALAPPAPPTASAPLARSARTAPASRTAADLVRRTGDHDPASEWRRAEHQARRRSAPVRITRARR